MLPLGKPAPAGALGSGHGAEILLDQLDVNPARGGRIAFPERDEDLRGGPGLAGEPSFPVQATVERRGKLFRFFADGPARFVRKRHDAVRSEYHAAIAPGRFRKNRRETDSEHEDDGERRESEPAPVALPEPGLAGHDRPGSTRAVPADDGDPCTVSAVDGFEGLGGVQSQRSRVNVQNRKPGPELCEGSCRVCAQRVRASDPPGLDGLERLGRVRAQLVGSSARAVNPRRSRFPRLFRGCAQLVREVAVHGLRHRRGACRPCRCFPALRVPWPFHRA